MFAFHILQILVLGLGFTQTSNSSERIHQFKDRKVPLVVLNLLQHSDNYYDCFYSFTVNKENFLFMTSNNIQSKNQLPIIKYTHAVFKSSFKYQHSITTQREFA